LAALKDAQQQLVLKEKMASIGTLTAGIAHEINNPVNFSHAGAQALVLSIEQFRATLLALAGDGPEAEAELRPLLRRETGELLRQVGVIVEGTTRIRDIVRNLRAFSRLDEAARKTVSLGDTILSTVRLVRMHYAETTEIECVFEREFALECWPAQLNQVFMNLIINACDAIGQRQNSPGQAPGKLQIRTRIEYDRLLVEFEDNGCGIAPDAIGRIFEPFFTTKEVGRGTGLGLAISYGIVRKHGGELRARSVAGQGSCFTVALPLVPVPQNSPA
ncbi:MAG TPA: ATP-binding protein, partial [Telluria sp.]